MKKSLFFFLAVAALLLGGVSCDKSKNNKSNSFTLGDKTFSIASAGVYYNNEDKGYVLMVADSVYDFTKRPCYPYTFICIEIPEQDLGTEFKVNSVPSSAMWNFYMACSINQGSDFNASCGPSHSDFTQSSTIKISKDGDVWTIDINAETDPAADEMAFVVLKDKKDEESKLVTCHYQGKPTVTDYNISPF